MTKDKALKLALDFVASISPAFICEATHHKKNERHTANEPCPHVAKQKATYEAIKEALADPSPNFNCKSVQARLATAWGYVKAQPEQEPVAWVHHLTFKNLNSFERSRYSTTLAKKQTDACCIPLYTNPPQRTWVGLTLDERIELAQDVDWAAGAYCEYAEKIESKLKEKNVICKN